MIDFHSHFLPEIDDGSKSLEQSIKMLDIMNNEGITAVVATPHINLSRHSIDEFLDKRNNAYDRVISAIENKIYPKIYLGAEVSVTTDLLECNELSKLCIDGTNHIMLEMPFTYWSDWVFRLLENIIYDQGLIPIIAHIERFMEQRNNMIGIERLLTMNVKPQLNSSNIINFFKRKSSIKLIQDKTIALLGTDCHDDAVRPPDLGKAYKIIEKKLGMTYIDEISNNGSKIIKRLYVRPNVNTTEKI